MSSSENKPIRRQQSEPIPENVKNDEENPDSISMDDNRINVSFKVSNQNDDYFKRSFKIDSTIGDVKKSISKLLKMAFDNVVVSKNDSELKDDVKLSTLDPDLEFIIFTKDHSLIDIDTVKEKVNESISVVVNKDVPKRILPPNITCKLHAVNQNHYFTKLFPNDHTIKLMKDDLSALLSVDKNVLVLVKNKSTINDDVVLSELEIDNFGNMELELFAKDGSKMKFESVYKDVPISDILTVSIPMGQNKVIDVNVEVIDARIVKPYLGGYRNKVTGLEYHHAFAQTQDFRSKVPPEMKNHRDTQTVAVRSTAMDTCTSRGTQMHGRGVYIPHVSDVVLEARPRWTSAARNELQLKKEKSATVIQRNWRAHRCRVAVASWLQQCRKRIEDLKNEELEEIRIRDERLKREMNAKTYPKTKDDFDQLYAMVDKWRNKEIARISKLHTKGPKAAEFCLLLDKEIELLRSIEKFRSETIKDFRKMKEKNLLEEMSKPIVWRNSKGKIITMDTVEAQKARELKELYLEFCREDLGMEERMKLLVNFKHVLSNYRSSLANQLGSLIDRECDLTIRNVPRKYLDMLRKRIQTTLFQFIKTSEFGGNVVKKHKQKIVKNMEGERLYRCSQCDNLKLYSDFPLHSRTENMNICTTCTRNNSAARAWVDMTPYKYMLKAIRRQEKNYKSVSSVAFVIQESDVHYLVSKIWHSRSAISECDDVVDLRLCRWDPRENWSPWNCILLTFKETKSHLKLEEPEEVYDSELVQKVHSKHLLAKTHFKHLIEYEKGDDS